MLRVASRSSCLPAHSRKTKGFKSPQLSDASVRVSINSKWFIPDYGKLNAITRDYAEDSSNARDGLKMSSVGHFRVRAARRRPATCLGA
jgi:hypothetical protein